jgi:rsbT co-antagonist protein RsbR
MTTNDPGAPGAADDGEAISQLHRENARLTARVAELEQALERHQMLAEVVDNSPNLIFVKDVEGRYLLINRYMEDFAFVTREQLLGHTDAVGLPPETVAAIRKKDLEVMAGGKSIQYEETIDSIDGSREFLTTKFPVYNARGELSGICGIATDITARKRAEAERTKLQEQVIAAQESALRELSTPLIPLADDVLVMPLVGSIDSARARQILEALLEGISRQRAHTAILDITGVRTVDAQVAEALVTAARAARLLGTRIVLTGVRREVARALVELNADVTGILTLGTLQSGIAAALRR